MRHLQRRSNQKIGLMQGYSPSEGVKFTVIPEPVIGPADNEIWYTSKNEITVTPYLTGGFGATLISNTYENGKGIIEFDNRVTKIGTRAFLNRTAITSLTIPSVESIGIQAFDGCTSLTSIVIPVGVTSIGKWAFRDCSYLTKTNYTGDITGWCKIEFGGASANPISLSYKFYINDQEIKDLVIPNTVDSIHDYTFYYCHSLTSVTIPHSVTSIGESAFYHCDFLTSITIPNSVTSIGESAFSMCGSLTSITFEGTMAEWNNVSKGDSWNYNVPATYIQCSDGQVAL